ncbi:MAG TPA: acyl-CoA dehydrogenase family protein [Acidimicrobiia bacterium]|nr:acyl-CoA dehydrogenase family protein [Acidimicrobiia bacterium]
MELEITEDQQFFVETTRRFLDERSTTAALRDMRDDPIGFAPDYWKQGAELGWTSLLVSEDDGGGTISGRAVPDLALVAFEFGKHAAPGPLVPEAVVAGAISRRGTDEQKAALEGLLSGELIAAWCYGEPTRPARLGNLATEAVASGDGVRLSGVKGPVEAGAQAQLLLVTARTGDGLTQLLVPADTPGVKITPLDGLDLTRRYATVEFTNVELPASAVLGELGGADADVDWQLQVAIALQLAEMVGAMDRAFAMTVEWSFDRYSFGRPLASYQELKHRFADMKLWLEASHAIADAAAAKVEDGEPEAWDYLSAGKAYIGHYGVELMHDCVQMHGGIGVTFEHDLHLFLRRVTVDSLQFGSVTEHRERLTAALEAQEEAA